MFGFGSSQEPQLGNHAPTREERRQCWKSRDVYFGCLDKNNVLRVGDEVQRNAKDGIIRGVCTSERESYEKSCVKAWVDYFNQRRLLELRRLATINAAEKSGNKDAAEAWKSVPGGQR
ncbi:hypothetical protein L204_101006 [Cryptococcus depauperatus]|nr:hypothetical protein L204_01064 [Cryptococcus depauperatus CBS 7855]